MQFNLKSVYFKNIPRITTILKTSFVSSMLLLSAVSYAGTVHFIEKGENLTDISSRFGITVKQIIEINDIKTPNNLAVGQEIKIPNINAIKQQAQESSVAKAVTNTNKAVADTMYRVQGGEHLTGIAKQFGVSLAALATANNLPTDHKLGYKDLLVIPNNKTVSQIVETKKELDNLLIHTVVANDGLQRVANKYQVNQFALAKLNTLDPYSDLIIGQVLKLPKNAIIISEEY